MPYLRSFLALLLALTASTTSATSEIDGWTAIGPFGSEVVRLVRSQPVSDRFMAVTFPQLHVTTDGGASWTPTAPLPDGCIANFWQQFTDDGPPAHVGWISPSGPPEIRVACSVGGGVTSGMVMHSIDSGATWQPLLQVPGIVTAFAVDATDSARMVAYSRFEVVGSVEILRWRTDNAGTSWTQELIGFCEPVGAGVHAAAFGNGTLYEWREPCQPAQPGVPFFGLYRVDGTQATFLSDVSSFATNDPFVPGGGTRIIPDGDRLYVQHGSALGRSSDGGITWLVVRTGIVAADVGAGRRVWAIAPASVAYSDDGGTTFGSLSSAALDTPPLRRLQSAAITTGPALLVGSAFGVHGWNAAAGRWQKSDRGVVDVSVRALDVSADGQSLIALSDSNYPVQRSFDGGATWHAVDTTSLIARARSLTSVPWPTPSGRRLVVAGSACFDETPGCPNAVDGGARPGLFFSDDEGATFQGYSTGLPPETDQQALRLQRHVIGATNPGGGVLLLAGGRSRAAAWSVVRGDGSGWLPSNGMPGSGLEGIAEPMQLAIDAGASGRAYVSTLLVPSVSVPTSLASGVFRSDDAGATWNLRSSGLPPFAAGSSASASVLAIEADVARSGRVWAASQLTDDDVTTTTVFRSNDAADTWHPCGALPPNSDIRDFAMIDGRPNTLVAADYGATTGPGGVWLTDDACRSWTRIGAARALFVAARNGELFAGTSFGVLRRSFASDVLLSDGFD